MDLTIGLFVGLILAVGGGIFAMRRVRPSRALPPVGPAATSVFSLKVGDIVQHLDVDYLVESTVTYTQDGLSWHSHLLGGPSGADRWLAVEEDDRVVIALVEEVKDLAGAADGDPPETLNYRGATFRRHEAGTAEATRFMRGTAQNQTVTCRYWDYEAADSQVLYIEDWPGEREVTWGRKLSASALTILPGS